MSNRHRTSTDRLQKVYPTTTFTCQPGPRIRDSGTNFPTEKITLNNRVKSLYSQDCIGKEVYKKMQFCLACLPAPLGPGMLGVYSLIQDVERKASLGFGPDCCTSICWQSLQRNRGV